MKRFIINYLVKKLFPIYSLDRLVTITKQGNLLIGGKLADNNKLSNLQNEARFLANTELWELLTDTLKHRAEVAMFIKSKDTQDLMNGKMILYTLDVQNNILNKILKSK